MEKTIMDEIAGWIVFCCAVVAMALLTGCGGALKIPELQPGDRIVVQYDRAERALRGPEQYDNSK